MEQPRQIRICPIENYFIGNSQHGLNGYIIEMRSLPQEEWEFVTFVSKTDEGLIHESFLQMIADLINMGYVINFMF